MSRLVLLVVLGLGGCQPHCELATVPIEGEVSAEARGLTAAVLERFGAATPLEVCVPAVRFRPGDYRGRYHTLTHGIRIHPEVTPAELPRVLQHELCHATERQHRLVRGPGDVFDERLWEVGDAPFAPRLEAFALVCEAGPDALRALWPAACPSDPRILDREGAVRDRAFGGPASAPPGTELRHAGHRDDLDSVDALTPTEHPTLLTVHHRGWSDRLDLADSWLPPRPTALASPCDVDLPAPWSPAGPGACLDDETPLAVIAELHGAHRLLVRTPDGGWAGVHHCLPEHAALGVAGDGSTWVATSDGDGLDWFQLVLPPLAHTR